MKKIFITVTFYLLTVSNIAMAGDAQGSDLPWEHAIETLQKSLFFLGGSLVLIGLLWAGYGFLAQGEKEAGFKRLLGTFIGGSIIFGAKTIVSTVFGASF